MARVINDEFEYPALAQEATELLLSIRPKHVQDSDFVFASQNDATLHWRMIF